MAEFLQLDLDSLMPDPGQPRKTFIKEELERLRASVAARGVLTPLRVLKDKERGCWVIVTGESRWRAARMAGLKSVPCIEIQGEPDEADLLADRLTENGVRHDLQPMEEAAALAKLKALKGCNSKTLVETYGFSAAAITRMESLLRLTPDIQAMVGTGRGQVPPSAAYEISRLDDEHGQRELAQAVADRRISRDQVADAVRDRIGKRNVQPKASRLAGKLDGGVSVSVSARKPLTQEILQRVIDHLKRESKKLPEKEAATTALTS